MSFIEGFVTQIMDLAKTPEELDKVEKLADTLSKANTDTPLAEFNGFTGNPAILEAFIASNSQFAMKNYNEWVNAEPKFKLDRLIHILELVATKEADPIVDILIFGKDSYVISPVEETNS